MRLRHAAIAGAVLAVGYVLWVDGVPTISDILKVLVDPVTYVLFAFIALAGAFCAVTLVRAWRNARESPRSLLITLAGLIFLSLTAIWPFVQETRETRRFLATADSTTGVVAYKYVRGVMHLVVDYEASGQKRQVNKVGQNPFVGTAAFSEWEKGDSIPVYYQPAIPDSVLVGDPWPPRRFLFESLAKLWIIWGVLLTAYPPIARRFRRRPAASRTELDRQEM